MKYKNQKLCKKIKNHTIQYNMALLVEHVDCLFTLHDSNLFEELLLHKSKKMKKKKDTHMSFFAIVREKHFIQTTF